MTEEQVKKIAQEAVKAVCAQQAQAAEQEEYARFRAFVEKYRAELRDNDCGAWSQKARQFAVDNGIFAGGGSSSDGQPNFMWEDLLTREQCAQVLYAFAAKFGLA